MEKVSSGMKIISRKSYKAALATLTVIGLISLNFINEETIAFTSELLSGSRFLQKFETPPPELVWLMSFPGAGSEDVIDAVEAATALSMGTNYGHKMATADGKLHVNLYPSKFISEGWYPRGPFKNNIDRPLSMDTVLVNTHCTGYCLSPEDDTGRCGRNGYIRTLIPHKRFYISCYRSRSYDPARKPKSKGIKPYWRAKVKKVVVLVRNPFDMIHARFVKSKHSDFGAYCAHINERWGKMREIRNAKETTLAGIDTDAIPCYPEFFRIFHWYNNAYTIAKKKQSMVVRYEDLEKNMKKTMNGVMKFLGLNTADHFRKFRIMDSPANPNAWSPEVRLAVKDFMHALGGPAMMKAYFTSYLNKMK